MRDQIVLAQAVTKAREIAAELKNIARDVTGLMYGRTTSGEHQLREYVPIADTNTRPPENCESFVWTVYAQALHLQEYLEQLHLGQLQGARLAMVCPCCAAVDLLEDVLDRSAGWKLVADTHADNLVGNHIAPVQEWQCGACAPYAHSESNTPKEQETNE